MIANREVLEAAESLPTAPPTERDLEIFAAVHVDCRRQVDVAAEFGISQSRVSQIVRDVVEWRAGMGLSGELEGRERKKVEAWLDAQRLEWLYEHTLDNYRRSCQPQRRERKGANQHGEWHDETIDHPPGNLQCLRLAARLLELRWKMEEKCPQPSPHALAHCDETTFINRLISMRHWAEVRGEVPRGEEPGRLVKRLLNELLGRGEKQPASAEWDSTKAPTSGRGDGHPSSPACAASGDGNRTLTNGQGFEEPGAPTAHIISAASEPYEPAGDADSDAASGCSSTTCDATRRAEDGPLEREAEQKNSADISADTAGQAGSGTATATAGRSNAEERRLALAELRRTISTDIDPGWADYMVPTLLAEGQANLVLQGFTREQRQALLGWQRVLDLSRPETGVRARG
jgi:hypothetical protein